MSINVFPTPIPAGGDSAGGQGFSLLVGASENTTYVFDSLQPAGAYSVSSQLGDTTFDIYLVTADDQNAGYTNTTALEATTEFSRIVLYGATENDILNFDFKPSSAPTDSGDVDGGAGPFLTSATPVALRFEDDTTVVTGGNFASDVEVAFIGQDDLDRPAKNIVRSSSTSLIVTRPDSFPVEQEPYSITASNAGIPNPSVPVNKLTDLFLAGAVDVLVVAGGGGGGALGSGGGGGAGGFRTIDAELLDFNTNFAVTVGAGGSRGLTSGAFATKGANSIFGAITSTGGGLGGGSSNNTGGAGGSGGGSGSSGTGGAGNQGGFTPQEGFNGGSGQSHGGGGGGAAAAGQTLGNNGNANGANGGNGKEWLDGDFYAGGAGSGGRSDPGQTRQGGLGGLGGGGNGGSTFDDPPAQDGQANKGGGGGGGGTRAGTNFNGANGGAGVVLVRYPVDLPNLTIGSGLVIDDGSGGNVSGTGAPEDPSTTQGGYKIYMIKQGTGNVSWVE